jgi:hypothetical protein
MTSKRTARDLLKSWMEQKLSVAGEYAQSASLT